MSDVSVIMDMQRKVPYTQKECHWGFVTAKKLKICMQPCSDREIIVQM
jgi:hypothetical protein